MGHSAEARQLLDSRLELGDGFDVDEREELVEEFKPLGKRLTSYGSEAVELTVQVADRDTPDQEVTLTCNISGDTELNLVGTSRKKDLIEALVESRRRVSQQLKEHEGESPEGPLRKLFGRKS